MTYTIKTRDGQVTLPNIPDELAPDSPEVKAMIAQARAGSGPSTMASHATPAQTMASHAPPQPEPEPATTAAGVMGAVNRGLLPYASGAALGGVLGAPAAGVGAVPGAVAGVAAVGLSKFVGDPLVSTINGMLGTKYRLPTEALEDLMTRIGIPQPRTEAERIIQTAVEAAAGAGSQVGLGQTLMRTGFKPAAQAAGEVLSAQPAAQIAGGLGSGAASQGAAEAGAGPLGQIGAGLVGGAATGLPFAMRGPRSIAALETEQPVPMPQMAEQGVPTPPVQPIASHIQGPMAKPLSAITKTAAEGGFGSSNARKILAEQASPNTKTIEAAKRLGIEEYLQPDHVTTNQAYREMAQAVKSVPGSQTRAAEIDGLIQVGERADRLITEIGGTTDLSRLSEGVKTRMSDTVAQLSDLADKAYKGMEAKIPKQTRGPATSVLEFVNQRANDLDGAENLSSLEKSILKKLSPTEGENVAVNNGEITAYHGSKYGIPGEIKPDKAYIGAMFFTDEPTVAKSYGSGHTPTGEGGIFEPNDGTFANKVEKVRLSIKNPITDETTLEDVLGSVDEATQYREEYSTVSDPQPFSASMSDGSDLSILAHLAAKSKTFMGYLKKQGYDGWIFNDQEVGGNTYIPFDTNQIKRAGSPPKNPTYALIDSVRRDIGAASKAKGPFADADTGLAKHLYKLIDDDQFSLAKTAGMGGDYTAAKELVKVRKGFENDLISIYGKQLDQSLVGKLESATMSLSKGDSDKLAKIMKSIPPEMRQEVAASALNTAFGKATQNGTLNFNTFSKWYEGLLANKQAYAALMTNLGPDERKSVSDLYRVAKNISLATRERITTGRIQAVQQEIQGADSLIGNIYGVAKRAAVAAPLELATSAMGIPGAGIAAAVGSALTKGKPNTMKLADELISSPAFLSMVKDASTNAKPTPRSVHVVINGGVFKRFAKAVNLPKTPNQQFAWVMNAFRAQNATQQEPR